MGTEKRIDNFCPELVPEHVDGITAEQSDVARFEPAVPQLIERGRRFVFALLPQHADHLTVGSNAGMARSVLNPRQDSPDQGLKAIRIGLAIYKETVER